MMNPATTGLGGALDLRPRDASLAPLGPAKPGQRSASSGSKSVFEDQLEESLASSREENDDEPTQVAEGVPAMQTNPSEERKAAEQTEKDSNADGHQEATPDASSPDGPTSECTDATAAAAAMASAIVPLPAIADDSTQIAIDDTAEAISAGTAASPEAATTQTGKVGPPRSAGSSNQPATREVNGFDQAALASAISQNAAVSADAPQTSTNVLDDIESLPAAPTAAETTPSEANGGSDATIAASTDPVFERLTEERGEESSDKERRAAQGTRGVERGEGTGSFKAPDLSSADSQTAATELRSPGLSGLGTAPLARLAEFEAARAGLGAESYANVPSSDTPDRIVQSLRLQFQRGGGDAVVQIKPEHLGPLTISLRVENGTVSAHVKAENPVTAEWLQANEQTLRDGLKSSGLQLDRLVVNRDQDPSGRSPQREESQAQRQQRRRFDGRKSTFEITV